MSFPISGDTTLLFEEQINTPNLPSDLLAGVIPSGSYLQMVSSSWFRTNIGSYGKYAQAGWTTFRPQLGVVKDAEMFMLFRFPTSREVVPRMCLRQSTTSTNSSSGYFFDINPSGQVQIGRGDQQWLSSSSPVGSFSINTTYAARFRVYGSTIYGKVWPWSSTEPSAWSTQVTDTMYTAAGYAGICVLPGYATQTTYWDLGWMDVFSVGANLPAAPVVEAGPPASGQIGSVFTRQGSVVATGSVTWSWAMTSKPSGSTATLTGGAPTVYFTPDKVGVYVLTATVTDTYGQSQTDTFTFTAVAKSTLGGRIVMLDDGQLHTARHRTYLSAGRWSA